MTPLDGIRCIGYIRVSTDRQAGEDRTSPADQRAAIEARAVKLGVAVGQWYQDEESGGTAEKRSALLQLVADCEASPRSAKAPGYVLALNDSRWGRFPDPEESAYWRTHLRKRCGWLVWFAENDDIPDLKLRTVMRAIVATQATQKREDVQRNARRGSRGTAAQGYWATRDVYGFRRAVVSPPERARVLAIGQRKAPDEKVKLTPHEPEASAVRALFDRYASGTESIASLTAWLRDEVPQRRWTRPAVKFTLTNPAYMGDVVSGRYSVELHEHRPDAEWIVTRNAHPAIVDRATFQRCQDVLARNSKWTSRVRTDWLVSGLVRCPCGRPYVAGGGNLGHLRSYRCVSKSGLVADRCAFPGAVKKEYLERAVIDAVGSVVGSPGQRRRLLAILDRALEEIRSAPADASAKLDRTLAELTTTRDRLVAAVADGTLTGDEAKAKLTDVRRQIARLEGQRDALAPSETTAEALAARRDRFARDLTDFRAMSGKLSGPSLREHLRPWIASAVFDPSKDRRSLTIEIRDVPALPYGDLVSMARPSSQDSSATFHTTRRVVRVGGAR